MQEPFDIAADLDTPVSAFLKLAPFRPCFLLESADGGERLGRYSFIGLGEAVSFTLDRDVLRIGGESIPAPVDKPALLNAFRGVLDRLPRPGREYGLIPFTGGMVGVTGYDLVRRLEKLGPARRPVQDLPEAAYVAPRSILVFDHLTRRAALLHDGPDAERQSLRRQVIAALRGAIPARPTSGRHSPPHPSLDGAAFIASVERAKRHIKAGDVFQLVLSICHSGSADVHPFEVYRALRLLNPSPYLYFLQIGNFAVVGSSPEALVKLNGRTAALRPIAGTRPRNARDEEDRRLEAELLADPKEAAEHVMLVDLARNDLGRVAVPGTIHVDPFRIVERYSHVMHLVSGVNGVLDPEMDAFDLFAATFPAGTVVGAPKVRAMELIDEIEPVGRGLYAGTVGYFGHGGGMDQAIAIRTLVFHEGTYTFQAGAGIVADSRPDAELAEVRSKAAALESALTMAEDGL
jgi:anthranilate synthase component I